MNKMSDLKNGYSEEYLNGDLISSQISVMDDIGDAHAGTSLETPLKKGAFDISDADKIEQITKHFREIMDTLGMDLTDDSLAGTPRRVAKMFVNEIFSGINPANKPAVTLFENKYGYRNMLVEKGIPVQSTCEHHFQPIFGKAHVGYIAGDQVIGLSKINRIVEYYSRRPQVQERLTMQIADELKKALKTEDVAVYIDAAHMCVQARGVEHHGCSTVTTSFSGKFLNENVRKEFMDILGKEK
jgi:GTP cyclohydrolase I